MKALNVTVFFGYFCKYLKNISVTDSVFVCYNFSIIGIHIFLTYYKEYRERKISPISKSIHSEIINRGEGGTYMGQM